ncbi:hypothetical protein NIES1031_19915 [Chroogloeocystis siderophila 5.2 s.c.1]|uniref:Uncharacterized protein n=1 Tax=Chroogloeocystis siderophila 5.2 s.c.1 TaxID=247279 RepID=A0A1U7HFS3_9CHRO|nr:hypothetical protein NIES1031_19915 [Chroogloeocystis siderophila 5.2 s.c.1]
MLSSSVKILILSVFDFNIFTCYFVKLMIKKNLFYAIAERDRLAIMDKIKNTRSRFGVKTIDLFLKS